MMTFAIEELDAAVMRAHPKWYIILADDALGIPYLRGHGARLSKAGLGARFRIWTDRCPPETQRELWTERQEFIWALAQVAREIADAIPERPAIVTGARDTMKRLLAEGRASGTLSPSPDDWPPVLVFVPNIKERNTP